MAGSDTGKEQKSGYDGNLQIEYANNRIIVKDGTDNRLLLGEDSSGDMKVKLSQTGHDVLSAANVDLIFSSDSNLFKIAKVINHTVTGLPASEGASTVYIPHGLDYKPLVLGSIELSATGSINMLPYLGFSFLGVDPDGRYALYLAAYITTVTDAGINVLFLGADVVDQSWFNNSVLKLYILRETAG